MLQHFFVIYLRHNLILSMLTIYMQLFFWKSRIFTTGTSRGPAVSNLLQHTVGRKNNKIVISFGCPLYSLHFSFLI